MRLAKTNGYDFIKAYNNLTADAFAAIVDEGRALGVRTCVGVITKAAGIRNPSSTRCSSTS